MLERLGVDPQAITADCAWAAGWWAIIVGCRGCAMHQARSGFRAGARPRCSRRWTVLGRRQDRRSTRAHGKNLIGAFHQPRLVLCDLDTLETLPQRELLAGYAEVVKYGLIDEPGFFDWCEKNSTVMLAGDADLRAHAVAVSCRAKARIVAADERENGVRALLNLGHTFGHALEAETGFGAELLHGEAVAIGMRMAFDLSVRLGFCPSGDAMRVRHHFDRIGLPAGLSRQRDWRADDLVAHMGHDKKVRDGKVTFILARGIGRSFVATGVDIARVREMLAEEAAA